jgi:hypothetical protein
MCDLNILGTRMEASVHMVRENLRIAQSRQKRYANHRRRELSFEVGGYVYLKVLPMRGLQHFKVRDNLILRFIGPFKIARGDRRRIEDRISESLF